MRPLRELGLEPDPADDPGSYPGRVPNWSYLLGPHGIAPLPAAGARGPADRKALVAVGSNAAPAQLARKLAGMPGTVPVLRAVAHGLAVAPAAQLSRPGYVPWAPVLRPGAVTAVHVTYLTVEQLAAIDATEPSYDRVPLPVPVVLESGGRVPDADVYRCRYGVVAGAVGDQRELVDRLLGLLPDYAALRTFDDVLAAAPIAPAMAASFRAALREAGLVIADGFTRGGP